MSTEGPYTIYTRRWYIVAIVTAVNVSNVQIWCSFSSVANISAEYFNVTVDKINILSMVYFFCCFPFGLFPLWFTDYVGLNKSVWIGACLNAIGAMMEFVSTTKMVPDDTKFNLTLAGQIIAGMAQMYLYVPTKVAELWFPANERTLATSLMAMASPFGIMLGVGVTSLLVTKPNDIPSMNLISCVVAVICAMATCGFTSSRPPTPPSESAENKEKAIFHKALKELFTNKQYLLLLLFGGALIGLSGVFCSLLQEILHPRGYSNEFSGLCVMLIISFGIVGGTTCGMLVDKTKAFTPVAKINGSLTCIIFPIYSVVLGLSGMQYEIAILSVIIGIVSLMAYTVLLELTVECTFPSVPEATSTGILFIFGQFHGSIFFLLVENFATNVVVEGETTLDMKRSILIVAGIMALFCAIFVIFFETEYKRTKEELTSSLTTVCSISSPSLDVDAENPYPVSYGTI